MIPKNFISRTIPSACDSGVYIYTKETVFERISHNKQFLDGLGGAAAHALTNWMTLYFSQDLRSADQFSEAKQTQPVHLQHHPACHSSML